MGMNDARGWMYDIEKYDVKIRVQARELFKS